MQKKLEENKKWQWISERNNHFTMYIYLKNGNNMQHKILKVEIIMTELPPK